MSRKLGCCFLVAVLGLFNQRANADWHVWTTTQTRHVLRGDPPGGELAVKLGAGRNECRGFQILLRSDVPVAGVRIEPGDLAGADGAVMRSGDARICRQHQTELTTGTYRNDRFKPDWYPDALIPFRHPVTGEVLTGGRYVAMPFDLPAKQTHGFWVDLSVPAAAKAGVYRGSFRVSAPGQSATEIPVEVTVWDFSLPSVPTLVTAFGSPAGPLRSYYAQRAKEGRDPEPRDWAAAEAECAQVLSEHRINATPRTELLRPVAQPDGSFRIPSERVVQLREFVDRHHVNALQTPHPSNAVKDPEQEGPRLRAWLAAFDQAAKELDRPQVVLFTYLKDEPNTLEDYRYVQKWGRAVRQAKSVVKAMVVEQPWTAPGMGGADSAWGDLYGAVDIWCPLFSLHQQDAAAKRQAQGEMIWTYTALCQGQPTPWWHTDYPLLNCRVPAWIAWRYRMTGLLYWGGMSYWSQVGDPWVEAPFYRGNGELQQGRKGIIYNGEGSMVYPARAVGYDGIAPSLRLKALRDSIQDYEYLAILQRLGKAAEAEKTVAPLAESFFVWEKDAAAYDIARAKLAELIVLSK